MLEPAFRECSYVQKNWGKEEIIVNNGYYCGKILHFKKGCSFSTHFHLIKLETFKVIGKIKFTYFDLTNATKIERICETGCIIDIPVGCPHRIEALEDCQIIEFSTHHEDSDSYRVEKGNGKE